MKKFCISMARFKSSKTYFIGFQLFSLVRHEKEISIFKSKWAILLYQKRGYFSLIIDVT